MFAKEENKRQVGESRIIEEFTLAEDCNIINFSDDSDNRDRFFF